MKTCSWWQVSILTLVAVFFPSSLAFAKGKGQGGVSLEFSLTQPEVEFTSADGTSNVYTGMAGMTQFQAPFYEADWFRIGGTLSYRYMEIKNTSITETQFASHSGFGLGLQTQISFIILGSEIHQLHAKDFLSGSGTYSTYSYNKTNMYVALAKQFGTLGLGVIYYTGQTTLPATAFNNYQESQISEKAVGLRLNYNFGINSMTFFKNLFSK